MQKINSQANYYRYPLAQPFAEAGGTSANYLELAAACDQWVSTAVSILDTGQSGLKRSGGRHGLHGKRNTT
jgi:hypothetical protein